MYVPSIVNMRADSLNALRCRDSAHNGDGAGYLTMSNQIDDVVERSACCEHGVNDDDRSMSDVGGEFVRVELWLKCHFISGDANKAEIGVVEYVVN